MAKTIIVYYSSTGNTYMIAKYLHDQLDWEMVAVSLKKPLRLKGFFKYLYGGFMAISGCRPKLDNIEVDWDEFDRIIIASPIWAGRMAPAIRSLIESKVFANKDIYFLYTNEGGAKNIPRSARKIISANNQLKGTFSCRDVAKNYEQVKKEALDWVKSL
ncbi:MAG: hypothetical protein PHI41_04125 [Erysipelotrichaceae bacterium]|nr:hypothetical protein [Erysipelotrichaceae bacterium]